MISLLLALACTVGDTQLIGELPAPAGNSIVLEQGYYTIDWVPMAITERGINGWVLYENQAGRIPGSMVVRTDPGLYASTPLILAFSTRPQPLQTWCNQAAPTGRHDGQLLHWNAEDQRYRSMTDEYSMKIFGNGWVIWESWRDGEYRRAEGRAVLLEGVCVYRCNEWEDENE